MPFSRVPIVLTVGAIEKRPRVVGDAVQIRPARPIGATIDHRPVETGL